MSSSHTPWLLNRRGCLQVGALGMLGVTLPQLLRAGDRKVTSRADACILLFLDGGPSHLDMWDMKPNAPAEIRGEFKPISSSLVGVPVSEHLPKLARHMHRCTLIRSAHHSVNNAHAAAVYTALTGHDRGEIGGGAKPTDHPAIGSVLGLLRPPETPVVPYVSMPYITQEGAGGPPQPGFFGGWMGRPLDPFFVLKDPNAPDFGMPELMPTPELDGTRLQARKSLVELVTTSGKQERSLQDLDSFQTKAFDLLTSTNTQKAFQLDREPLMVREAYGRNIYGQSTLLARRLIEAGTRVACISWAPHANATWDTHGSNFKKLKEELLPQLDSAVSSLLEDLSVRGMLDRTLVVVMGEFGRTPKINGNGGGRDHWNFCYSLLLAGGGLKAGHVHGSSDRIGAYPSSNPVVPADIVATLYECLGLPAETELRDRVNRPTQLVPWGSAIHEVMA